MGIGPLVGFILALLGCLLGAMFKGVNPVVLMTNVPAILIVIVGSFGATMMSFKLSDTIGVVKAIMRAFFPGPEPDLSAKIELLASLADRGRKEGLLALEADVERLDDPLLRKGLQLAIDGAGEQDMIAGVMEAEIEQRKARHAVSASWLEKAGIYSPTFGIIGAVMGLIATLSHLDDPSKLGAGISAAFVATFWGVYLANGFYLPLSNNLKRLSAVENNEAEMVVEGVLAIQAGQQARVVRELLSAYLPPSKRTAA